MSTTDAIACAAMVREYDFPRYAATLFAPERYRRALFALAAFDLEVTRIPDQVTQPLPGEVRLQWWIDAIEGTEHGGVAGHPVAAELLRAVTEHGLQRAPLLSLIEAHKFDLYADPMPTLAALDVYCDDTAGSLLRSGADIIPNIEVPADLVRDGGRALGLARIVTRLAHDAARGRCFLPVDLMAACGVERQAVLAGEDGPALRDARGELIAAAQRALAGALALLKTQPRDMRPPFLPLASLGDELAALETAPSFVVAPPPSRLRVLTRQWWLRR